MKIIKIENYICKIGQNALENWQLLDDSKFTDWFFHLSSFPSCYVILEYDELPDLSIILKASQLCKDNTKYKNLKNIKVDYTQCSNIQKGEFIGEVIYKSKRKIKTLVI